jgi:Tol biopolymer transport system component
MNTDGRGQVNLTKTAKDDIETSWSPDGTKIAFASNREQNFELFIMNSDGSGQHNLTRAGTTDEKEPAWSPDGTKIAYSCHKDSQDDIYIMTVKGTNQVNITNNPISDDRSPCWSPDSKKIAFMSNRSTTAESNYWEICIINVDGGKVINLTNNSCWDGFPRWVK